MFGFIIRFHYVDKNSDLNKKMCMKEESLKIFLGVDIGSTTVKIFAIDNNGKILAQKYERHHSKQGEKVFSFLRDFHNEYPHIKNEQVYLNLTGSGASTLNPIIGGRFVQEVNAVALAVEEEFPDASSVVELGGQDAKVILFTKNKSGENQVQFFMNEKCASGTGATIDKCLIKVGIGQDELKDIRFDPNKLHHVASKCGVFAETDIVNLVKTGVPAIEILNSLADAIVNQNLASLTKGNTLRPKVILLGGPNTFMPFLIECWRHRIQEIWAERGLDFSDQGPVEDLILVPNASEYYAAKGCVLFGMNESKNHQDKYPYNGIGPLRDFISSDRRDQMGDNLGPALVESEEELHQFKEDFKIPKFIPDLTKKVFRGYIGIDGGSTSSKCVLVDSEDSSKILLKEYVLSKGNPIVDMKEMLLSMKTKVENSGGELIIEGMGVTGYAADVLSEVLKADVAVIETIAHMQSSIKSFGEVDVICDIGGQDIKVLFLKSKELRNFKLSNQCSAGNGMILQGMADQFNIPVTEYANHAFKATLSPKFTYGCGVFLDSDRVSFQKLGYQKEELMAGLALVLPKNIWQYVVQVPRLAEFGTRYVLQGGTQYNQAALKAQVDYIKERVPNAEVFVHPHPGEAGAIGAALEAKERVEIRGYSQFIGLKEAINIQYSARSDESTRCNFCPNLCTRTFIDAWSETDHNHKARYISGFSCEKGTVENKDALIELEKKNRANKRSNPNLVGWQQRKLFSPDIELKPMPDENTYVDDYIIKKTRLNIFKKEKKVLVKRPFQVSSYAGALKRKITKIGIPKGLNIWVTAPFWKSYFMHLGVPSRNIVFSDFTDERMAKEGIKYGSIDPCYPAKVTQAHIHNLLYEKHKENSPLHYIFFPSITHIPTYLNGLMGETACPVVQGTPNVMKASFTREMDFFARFNIEYIDGATNFVEPRYLEKQLFEMWGERLDLTPDENCFAIEKAFETLKSFNHSIEMKGKEILERVEAEDEFAVLILARPYHVDPGLSHLIAEEVQSLGYPVLTMRSIPKDPNWLKKYFKSEEGESVDPLSIQDVWPENFSTNSAQKVWAAKFAARHPNVAVVDLSSFKCGHDAPTYGIIESIINHSNTPYLALHDLDQVRPTGSLKIRLKTFGYNLEKRKEILRNTKNIKTIEHSDEEKNENTKNKALAG